MKSLFAILAAGLLISIASPVQAGTALDEVLGSHCRTVCTITGNRGGQITVFQAAAQEVLDEGKHLVIDGLCESACVVLADLARENTCITTNAELGVHQGSVIRVPPNVEITATRIPDGEVLRRKDPPQSEDINRWVQAHGGYPTEGVLFIPVKDARSFWPMCGGSQQSERSIIPPLPRLRPR